MRNNILTLLVGFVVMLGSIMLFKVGLDKMTDANAADADPITNVDVDMERKAILYRVKAGDTLWSLAESFYGKGNRWSEIAAYNNIPEGHGIEAGAIIKIPLRSDETAAQTDADTVANYEDTPDGIPVGAFGINDDTVGVTHCRVDDELFPDGAICIANTNEQECIRVMLFDAADAGNDDPVATYVAPHGDLLRHINASDLDGDGQDEVFTVWQTGTDSCTSRVLKYGANGIEVVSETPQDPIAVLRLREKNE
ncbi:LysM domain-containing protein [Planctomycetota bacterium]|nr:LysM domain-containing protein [Planctomycetota bacterium]